MRVGQKGLGREGCGNVGEMKGVRTGYPKDGGVEKHRGGCNPCLPAVEYRTHVRRKRRATMRAG